MTIGKSNRFSYWTGELKLLSGRAVDKAKLLKLKIFRRDNKVSTIEQYNHKTKEFEVFEDG